MKVGARRSSDVIPETCGFDKEDCEVLVKLTRILSLTDVKATKHVVSEPQRNIVFSPIAKEKQVTLEDIVLQNQQKEVLSYEQKNLLVMRCTQALEAAHQQRKIHGDIKPSSFVVKIDGDNISVKLVGFNPSSRGTKGYVAPEVAEKGHSVKSDIYSFGRVLKALADNGFGQRFEFLAKRMCLKPNNIKNPEVRQSLEVTIQFLNEDGFKPLKEDGERIGEYRHRWEPSGMGMRFTNKNM